MIGEKIGPYRITACLGKGGMGSVYLAEEPGKRKPVALKILDTRFAGVEEAVTRFSREANILANLDDPRIVRLLAPPTALADTYYFVMEYVEGRSVRDLLAELGCFGLAETLRISFDVLTGLSAAHQAGVIHRDLKPGNIMVRKSGRAKITDFGLGLFFGGTRFTASGEVFGTPAYMSPEQAQGSNVDARSDLYAAGILIYEMLTGRPPFQADHPLVLMRKIVEEQPPPLRDFRSGIPDDLETLVAQAMAKDPAERFSSAEDMAKGLKAVELPTESVSDPTGIQEIIDRETMAVSPVGPKRRAFPLLGLALTVLMAGGILGLLWLRGGGEEPAPPKKPSPTQPPAPLTPTAGTAGVMPSSEEGAGSLARVRLILATSETIVGDFISADGEGIVIRDKNGKTWKFAFKDIRLIEHLGDG
ncbi:MAG: protein kinase domain-containing protein [Planctomycetota bacterium]|jgi:serine/threonine protein kinase